MRAQVLKDFIATLNGLDYLGSWAISTYTSDVETDKQNNIVINASGGMKETFYKDSFGLAKLLIQLDIYSVSTETIEDTLDALASDFNGFSGTLNNNSYIQSIKADSISSGLLSSGDLKVKRGTLQLELLF